ncbi:MAG TPA: TetR/AcrR family transcriptional regulator [Acidimicrobiales bacterium]|jgi:AcrR family transcriptional regulator
MGGRATASRQPTDGPADRKPERKDAIAHEAARLFAERGFAAVGIDDIGAAVGITGPAIYRHFAGKDALLDAVIVTLLDDYIDVASSIDPAHHDPRQPPLDELIGISTAIALDHPHQVATYIRERARLEGESARQAAAKERQLRTLWQGIVRSESPEMAPDLIVLRQQAVLGAMGAMTVQRGLLARPRLDQLLTAAALRMLRVAEPAPRPARAAAPTVTGPADRNGTWQPQVSRRESILNAALTLMRIKGYHGVGIDEIGDAAGISGPAVYRHYASKADILLDAYDRVGSKVAVGVEAALAGARGPSEALDNLIESYVSIAMDNVDLIIATGQEGAALPSTERPRLARQRRAIAEGWSRVVVELRPELAEAEVHRHVASVFPMVNYLAQVPGRGVDRATMLPVLVRAFLLEEPARG